MGFVKEFKEFAVKGNAIDLAVGVIIGAAFGKIVTSIIDDLLMPLISRVIGQANFSNLWIDLNEKATSGLALADAKKVPGSDIFAYGNFITVAINFLLIAIVIFMMVKGINKLKKKEAAKEAVIAAPSTEEVLLTEIRDALRNK